MCQCARAVAESPTASRRVSASALRQREPRWPAEALDIFYCAHTWVKQRLLPIVWGEAVATRLVQHLSECGHWYLWPVLLWRSCSLALHMARVAELRECFVTVATAQLEYASALTIWLDPTGELSNSR